MSCKYHISIVTLTLAATASCGGASAARTAPDDPFASVSVGTLPVGVLAGGSALLLPVGGVFLADSVAELEDLRVGRAALAELAAAELDSACRREVREVTWVGLSEQRRAARRSPALGLEPDRLPTGYLLARRVETIPDPLWASLRTLSALTGARLAVVPAGVKFDGRGGALTATYVVALVDVRLGQMVWRARASGVASPTAEAALRSAAGAVVLGVSR